MPDGPLQVAAVATDMANNTAMIHRTFVVDNTRPTVTIASTNFYVESSTTWWTES